MHQNGQTQLSMGAANTWSCFDAKKKEQTGVLHNMSSLQEMCQHIKMRQYWIVGGEFKTELP